jgi:acetyl-CoA synthetase
MLPEVNDYEAMRRAFRWELPQRYNIGVDICDRWAAHDPERVALIHMQANGRRDELTYGELKASSDRLANALRAAGVERGDRVGLLLPQRPETAITHVAVYKLGAIALPLAVLFGPDALQYRLANAGVKALVTDASGLEKIRQIGADLPTLQTVICVDGGAPGALDFHGQLATANAGFEAVDTALDDPAVMVYTSGTTGPPKGALHAHRVLLGHVPGVQFSHEFFPQPGDLMWTPADWAWAGGLFNILLSGLRAGVPVLGYAFSKFDPETAFGLIEEAQVRNCFIPPTALKMMRAVERPAERFKLNLRTLGSGGEALGREVYEWARQELRLTVNEFYGQTECNYVLSSCAAIGVSRPGAIGKPVPGHDVAVISAQGRRLGVGELGQIAVRAPDPVMFLEYWGRPDATREKFVGEWMTTGDQGIVDEDGYIEFVGRDDDVITSAGFRIGPGEIEDCLIGHPAVSLAAAVGKPDPLRTEIVKAFILLAEGHAASPELAAEIQDFVRTRLSAHEYPREIAFVKEMPLTTTGKVIRRHFRDQVRLEAETASHG